MKLAIIYASVHHKNTEKLVNAIAKKYPDTLLIDSTSVVLKDLVSYDVIGIASGIFYGKMHKSLIKFLQDNLPEHKKTFIMFTSGQSNNDYGKDAEALIQQKKCSLLGKYNCRGFDTFGPFKLVGGLQKGHPTEEEINSAVEFVDNLLA